MSPEITVIVPVYNVEPYVKECIDSILNQTYKDFELLLINDGSTDNSGYICDQYQQKDGRIRVIHKKNEGLSSARNTGIRSSKGKYLVFIDSDDLIDENMLDILHSVAISSNSDIVLCDFIEFYSKDNIEIKEIDYKIKEYSQIDSLKALEEKDGLKFIVAWNKIYNSKLFNDLEYRKGKIHEDEFIAHRILHKAKGITYVNKVLYFYRQRESSIMKQEFNITKLDALDALKDRFDFYRFLQLKELQYNVEYRYIQKFFKDYFKTKYEIKNSKEKLKYMRNQFKKDVIEFTKNPKYTAKEKLIWILFCINPYLYEKYHELKGIKLV